MKNKFKTTTKLKLIYEYLFGTTEFTFFQFSFKEPKRKLWSTFRHYAYHRKSQMYYERFGEDVYLKSSPYLILNTEL
jgi:hypothetical protein